MFIAKKYLPRRTFLRGMGATIALPLLDSMLPAATALANTAASPQTRYSFLHLPHGAIMGKFTPKTAGKSFDITPILEPFRPYQSYMTVLSNLDHQMATSQTPEEAAGDHDRTASVFLSGAHVKRTPGSRSIKCWLKRSAKRIRCRRSRCASRTSERSECVGPVTAARTRIRYLGLRRRRRCRWSAIRK
jgi:hypothetical protein